jgi:hypothetical protein
MKLISEINKLIKEHRTINTLILLTLSVFSTNAQHGNQGNTYIFGGAEMTFFGAHDFENGGNGALPGIIGTVRTAPFGVLNFAEDATSHTGGSDEAHVDGYVRKYGSDKFQFPTGDNGRYGPFAAANGTMGAYFYGNATTAVTSNLAGGNYPVLPASGPFPTATYSASLNNVSPIEYWDIDGTNPTQITLVWDVTSDINTLTNNELNKLTIAGWNGTQWVPIPSTVDPVAIVGGSSTLAGGSITTIASIIPNTYTAYTFASLVVPLPVTLETFVANKEGNTIQLAWATSEEINSDYFGVEHSTEGRFWKNIGTVKASGESSAERKYIFDHPAPAAGDNYYRLKMVDKDQSFTYSPLRSIVMDIIGVYPNPATDHITLPNYQQINKIEIVDLLGRSIYQAETVKNRMGKVSLPTLKKGVYMLITTDVNGQKASQKLMIGK